MAVANERILQKMMLELKQAMQNQHNQPEMLKNIENIRLLCDLFLPESQPQPTEEKTDAISEEELKAMIGETPKAKSTSQQTFKRSIELDDEGNGDSIFDF
ncbi:YwdI family protein [Ornithinibacillus sp. FSL M8-0202]